MMYEFIQQRINYVRYLLVLILSVICFIIILSNNSFISNGILLSPYKMILAGESMKACKSFPANVTIDYSNHIILQWNSPKWLKDLLAKTDTSLCNYNNCIISFDRALFDQSSAVIFNLAHKKIGKMPDCRNLNQTWVFFTLESPVNIWKEEITKPRWQNGFNWSWTYKSSSDIVHPYGIVKARGSIVTRNYSDIFRKKKKFAAWAVSHCKTPSKREKFVKILQKYIDIDIFGDCGTKAHTELKSYISTNYKFYLGFENSFCEDYMTEKLFHYYTLDVITVLRGLNNYTTYLPDGSFIDTANFSSISALGKYMKYLADNEEEYVKYLKIKDRYDIYGPDFVAQQAVCAMCEKLNNVDKYRRVYSNVVEWLGPCDHDIHDLIEDNK